MSHIVLLFFFKSYYLGLCVWRISFEAMQIASALLLWELRRLGCTNEGNLQMKRSYWSGATSGSLFGRSWTSLASASAEVHVFLRSPCFLLAVSFHDSLGKKYELHHPRYCIQFLSSIAFWFYLFFSWPRI